jgi:hypothetical protein
MQDKYKAQEYYQKADKLLKQNHSFPDGADVAFANLMIDSKNNEDYIIRYNSFMSAYSENKR